MGERVEARQRESGRYAPFTHAELVSLAALCRRGEIGRAFARFLDVLERIELEAIDRKQS
jgi:hypothetical protein